jgi:ankyrin repeat protein
MSLLPNPAAADVLRRYNEETLPDFCEPLTDVNQVGTFGNRPLHLASSRGTIDDVAALIDAGADVNATGDMGSTPLHEAVERGHVNVVRFLLDHGADRGLRNEFGQTPLDIANLNGNEEISKILVRARTEV